MSVELPTQPAETFSRRRSAIAKAIAPMPAILFSGQPRPRNYPANVHPFRAESHFLYLTGAIIPAAALVVTDQESTLFMQPSSPEDALWHGPTPPWSEVQSRTGVSRIRPLDELHQAITDLGGPTRLATVPATCPITRAQQRDLLRRAWPLAGTVDFAALAAEDQSLTDALIETRLRHDAEAVANLRQAAEGTTAAHRAGMGATRGGRFERQIRAAMEYEFISRGMECAYGSIVTVSGEVLHNNLYHQPLRDGDLVLADVGGEFQGWASDVTRTWPVSGRFSATQRALYEVVLQAQSDAIAMVAPGVRYRDVHLKACLTLTRGLVDEGILRGDPETLVERGAHALFFPHGVGHLLGLDVHDLEDLGDRAGYGPGRKRSTQFGLAYLRLDRDLEPGMAVTIEPGLYFVPAILEDAHLAGPFLADGTVQTDALSRFRDVRGIRIEDDVLCTRSGHEVLTPRIPKHPDEVEAAVGSA